MDKTQPIEPLVTQLSTPQPLVQDDTVDRQTLAEAEKLRGDIASAVLRGDRSGAESLLAELKGLDTRAGLSNGGRASVQSFIADGQTQVAIVESAPAISVGVAVAATFLPQTAFEMALVEKMSKEEQAYFNSIDPNKMDYRTVEIDKDGNRIEGTISGKQLRSDMLTIQKESLPPAEQKEIEALQTPDEKQAVPKTRLEALERLDEALKHTQARKEVEIIEAQENTFISTGEAHHKRTMNHLHFSGAAQAIKDLKNAYKDKEAEETKAQMHTANNPALAPLANAMLESKQQKIDAAEKALQKSLKTIGEDIGADAKEHTASYKPTFKVKPGTHPGTSYAESSEAEHSEKTLGELRPTQVAVVPPKQPSVTQSV